VEESNNGLLYGIVPVFVWRDWGKPLKTLVRIADLRAEIWSQNLQKMNQECQTLDRHVQSAKTLH
jgi:riboflavin synthase